MSINELRNCQPGETCWIVGKGPSLRYLQVGHFGPGPVIALNDAIIVVQELAIQSVIYSLQKDGDPKHMVEPYDHIPLILQDTEGYSRDWYPNHPARILVDPIRDLGFDHPQTLAVRIGIAIAKLMGCAAVKMVCTDNLVTGALETFNPRTGDSRVTGAAHWYQLTRPFILEDLKGVNHEFIIPMDIERENMRTLSGDNTI